MTAELAEGAQIGRYGLLTRIARGGMANVWLARATGAVGFQKTVVIKTILPHLAGDPEFVRMFIDEAILAAKLDHPNIVHIFDLGEFEGAYFIAMEYCAGRTLRHVELELRRTRRVPPPWLVLHVAATVCDALHYAHNRRDDAGNALHLVHRDISPENIMVSFEGDTKVLDFGIAKASTAVSKTRVGVIKGKYPYMSPEQLEQNAEGFEPDPRVDVYSLGVVMYELISGRRPFRAGNELALMRQILDTPPEPLAGFCEWVPLHLSDLVLKAMARNPGDRFQSAADFRAAIDEYFQSTASVPSRRHVADYLRSLFGGATGEITGGEPSAEDIGSGRHSVEIDPWSVQLSQGDPMDSSVTIDLSMMLISGEEDPDIEPLSRRSPAGMVSTRSQSSPPQSSPQSSPPQADGGDDEPKPDREHPWDQLARKAREQKQSALDASEAQATAPSRDAGAVRSRDDAQALEPDRHAWDAAVGRIRRPDAPSESKARELFEQGLEHMKAKEPERALACWMTAVELAPDNRTYQGNLRVLKRQLAERGGDRG